jgi:hypothetical protein
MSSLISLVERDRLFDFTVRSIRGRHQQGYSFGYHGACFFFYIYVCEVYLLLHLVGHRIRPGRLLLQKLTLRRRL